VVIGLEKSWYWGKGVGAVKMMITTAKFDVKV